MVVVLTEVSAERPPPLTEPERNAMASLPTVTNSRTAQPGSPSGGNCSISFRTRQGQAACGGGSVLPPARNLRTAFFDERIQQVRSGRESLRSSLRIGAVIEAN